MTNQNLLRQTGAMIAVVVAGVVWFALPAAAQITGSVHDLNSHTPTITMTDARVCVACHTPHNGDAGNAPLWNHDDSAGGHTAYDSPTLDATVPVPAGVSLMCLGCHDGSAALDAFGAGTRTVGAGAVTMTGNALFGLDMTNDHPVSFTYDDALATTDGQLHAPTTTTSGLGGNIDADMLFGLSNDQLECSSCHDVHNGPTAVTAALLIKDNTASALCFTCHDK